MDMPVQNEDHLKKSKSFDFQLRDPIASADPKDQELNRTFDVISDFITHQKDKISYKSLHQDSAKRLTERYETPERILEEDSESLGSNGSNASRLSKLFEPSKMSAKKMTEKFKQNRKS